MTDYSIVPIGGTLVTDHDLEDLLRRVYVGGGFTDLTIAREMFRAANVRARGELLVAQDQRGQLLGTVIAVFPGSPACRFAGEGEAELHLLCVSDLHRGKGIGSALVEACLDVARRAGARRLFLWTQASMVAARRAYLAHGFERVPELDFSRDGRRYEVLACSLENGAISDGADRPILDGGLANNRSALHRIQSMEE